MEDMESKIGAILGNPDMMQQIMAMAQQFQSPPEQPPSPAAAPDADFSFIQKMAPLLGKARIDSHQQALLQALSPYLSTQRIAKLQKAMRAAKLAGMASVVLGSLQAGDDYV
ncbi:MAG: hypothetical protein IJB47_04965 [Oscillospiraceae bacterium]|nr:hypothetical protein [Oscillospiraceae bacterium]